MKRVLILAALAACSTSATTEDADAGDGTLCGLSLDEPANLARGVVSARVDGVLEVTEGRGYWINPGDDRVNVAGASISIGMLRTDTGESVLGAIRAEHFPICVRLGNTSPDAGGSGGYASAFSSAGRHATSADNGGAVIIIGKRRDELIGRFSFDAVEPNGGVTAAITQGEFALPPAP